MFACTYIMVGQTVGTLGGGKNDSKGDESGMNMGYSWFRVKTAISYQAAKGTFFFLNR